MKKNQIQIFLFIVILILYLLRKISRQKLPPLDADIVIGPGGYKGVYTIGICHYLKNHFNVKDKTFLGFSSGSFNSLFMTLDKEKEIPFLKSLFTMNQKRSMVHFLRNIIEGVRKIDESFFDIKRLQVGVSTPNGIEYFKKFLTLEDALYCCKCSSFVPFVTYHEIFMFYKNRLIFDGGLYYKSIKKRRESHILFIDSTMFGRYKTNLLSGLRQPSKPLYQLYLDGYHDARKNHTYFEKFFQKKIK